MVCERSSSTQCCGCDPGGATRSCTFPWPNGTAMGLSQPSNSQGKAATCTLKVVGTNHTPMVKGKPQGCEGNQTFPNASSHRSSTVLAEISQHILPSCHAILISSTVLYNGYSHLTWQFQEPLLADRTRG